MRPHFIFKGISSLDLGIMVNELPQAEKPQERVLKTEVDGRDGFLIESLGSYQGTTKTVECTLKPGADIDKICAWLNGGGEVIFSNEPDKLYEGYIINSIPFKRVVSTFRTFIVQFECQPFKKSLDLTKRVFASAGTIINFGTAVAKPVITLVGSGNITLTINGKNVVLTSISGGITIDSILMDAYSGTTLLNNKMLGDFPEIKPGENTISWVGTVTSLTIEFRETYY